MLSTTTHRLPTRILCLVTDVKLAGGVIALLEIVSEAVGGGVNMVQVRARDLVENELAKLASGVVKAAGNRALIIVNGSPQAAIRSGAHGLHLPEKSHGARELAEKAHGAGLLVGRSVHSPESATAAVEDGADYLIGGTVFESRSHPGGPVCGLVGLSDMVKAARGRPVIGIGGIGPETGSEVIAAGAAGVAVIGAIIGVPDPRSAATQLTNAIAPS